MPARRMPSPTGPAATTTMQLNQYSALLACAFVNGCVFSILFWVRAYQAERQSDTIFGLIIFASCLHIVDWMLGFMGIHLLWEELLFIPYDVGFIIGPLMFFYLKSQLDTTFQLSRANTWHLLPYLVYIAYHLGVFMQGQAFTRNWSDTVHIPYYLADIERLGVLVSNFAYLFWSLKLYQHYRQWLPTQYSNPETISFAWYRHFLLAYALAIVVNWLYIFAGMAGMRMSYTDIWWEKFMVGIIIYYVSIRGYSQLQPRLLVFKEEQMVEPLPVSPPEKAESLAPDLLEWKTKLLIAMEVDKMYLEAELALLDLATHLHISPALLSIVINKGFGKNFNDFVNGYRIKEFQSRAHLPENQHLTLLGIAMGCGFNSKATFNRVFKKMTGKSPRESLGEG
jgi:AraC-like DNA-binding protein